MTSPWVGEPSDDYRAVCAHSVAPGEPQCPNQATRHVGVYPGPHSRPVALESCDDHAPLARASGSPFGEHSFEGWCGLPGTVWSADRTCCEIDDSGQSRAEAHATEGATP